MNNFIRKYSISIFSISIIVGVYCAFLFQTNTYQLYLLSIIAVAYLATVIIYKPKKYSYFLVIIIILFGFLTGILRGKNSYDAQTYEFSKYYDSTITMRGTVSEYPDERTGYTYLTISNVRIVGTEQSFTENVLVRAPLYPRHHYGQYLEINGKLQKPKDIENTENPSRFSYPKFLSVTNIYSVVTYPKIQVIEEPHKSFRGALYIFKDRCITTVTTYIREPEAGMLVGILFGIKKAVNEEVLQMFVAAGVVHVVVLSGYNIAVVIEGVGLVLGRLSKRSRYVLSYLAIYIFVVFVGAGATVLRAGIMASIALLAKQLGRVSQPLQVLAIVTAGISLHEPRMLLYDMSFKLSLLATLGLILFTSKLAEVLNKVPQKYGLREILASTIATQITVVPYLLFSMGKISLVGVIANIFIVPLIPIIMFFGFVTVVLGLIYLPLSSITAFITFGVLYVLLLTTATFSKLPFASVNVYINLYELFFIYVVGFYFVSRFLFGKSLNK